MLLRLRVAEFPGNNELPPLRSVGAINDLKEDQLVAYLTGYNVAPLPVGLNPLATDHLRKEGFRRYYWSFNGHVKKPSYRRRHNRLMTAYLHQN